MIALPSKTIAILIGTMAVVGALTTTCARLEFDRRRFESTLELDRRKFEHEQARLLFDRDERTLELERRKFEDEQARHRSCSSRQSRHCNSEESKPLHWRAGVAW